MTSHSGLGYHLTACARMHEFLATYEQPSHAINIQLDSQARKQIEENQQVIESLMKIVIPLGKQGLAFHGHRDDKVALLEETGHPSENHGNFIELVRFKQKLTPY